MLPINPITMILISSSKALYGSKANLEGLPLAILPLKGLTHIEKSVSFIQNEKFNFVHEKNEFASEIIYSSRSSN